MHVVCSDRQCIKNPHKVKRPFGGSFYVSCRKNGMHTDAIPFILPLFLFLLP